MAMPGSGDRPSFVVRQEVDRVDRRRVVLGSALVLSGIALSVGVTIVLLPAFVPGHAATTGATPPPAGTVEHSLILATERGITERNAQRATLDRYGWVDRDAGIARIPIEQAMTLLAEEAEAAERPNRSDGGMAR